MALVEYDISPVDENKIFKPKGISQIVLSECKDQLQASSSSKYVCFYDKYGHLFVAINNYLTILSLNDVIEAAEAANLNKNEKVETLKKRVVQFPFHIHAIFINNVNSQLGVYALRNTSNKTINTFFIYNIDLLLTTTTSTENVNDALLDSVVMLNTDRTINTTELPLLCIESLENGSESPYFRLVAVFRNLPPLQLFYDEKSKKYAVEEFLAATDVCAICVDPFNNKVYIGTNDGQLKVANSLKELNNINHIQKIPSAISDQPLPLEVSSIQCINNGSIIVHYIGPETSENGCRFPYSVIYSDDFKHAHICQNLFYFDSEAAEKGYPLFRATVLDSQLCVLLAYMSLSPDAEVIFKNLAHDANQYSQVILDEEEKFTCPVAADFTQTNVIGSCSIPIDFVPFTRCDQKNFCDMVVLLSSDGILMLSCIDWLVPMDSTLKKITYLSQCRPLDSNMELPLYTTPITTAISTTINTTTPTITATITTTTPTITATINTTIKTVEKSTKDPFDLQTLMSTTLSINDTTTTSTTTTTTNVVKEELIDLKSFKPTDFSPTTRAQLQSITLDPVIKPDFVVFETNKNSAHLTNVLELLKPLATFQSIMDAFDALKFNRHKNNVAQSIDEMLEELKNLLNLKLDTCTAHAEATTKDVHSYLEHKACVEFLTKLSVTCNAQLTLINSDDFTNYNTFHSHDTPLLDKIVVVERQLQSLLPRIKTTYEKLRPKPRKIVCSMNKLESHTMHHLNNVIDKYACKRELLVDRMRQLALKTNQFVDLNIDNVYRGHIKTHIRNKIEKRLSKFTPINHSTDSSTSSGGGYKKCFFKSIELFYKVNNSERAVVSGSTAHLQHLECDPFNKFTGANYCSSTPETNRRTSNTNAKQHIISYDIDPSHYLIDDDDDDRNHLTPKSSSFNLDNAFDNLDQFVGMDFFVNNPLLANTSTTTFNFTDKSVINNEWSTFIGTIQKLDDIAQVSVDKLDELLNEPSNLNDEQLDLNNDPLDHHSIFNVYNESAMKLVPSAAQMSHNFRSVETIQNILNEISYSKQLIKYCAQRVIKYNPTSVDYSGDEEDHLVSVCNTLGLPCGNYLKKDMRESGLNAPILNTPISNDESISNVPVSNDESLSNELNIFYSSNTQLSNDGVGNSSALSSPLANKSVVNDNKPIEELIDHDATLSDSSDYLDLTKIEKEDELPLFIPLGLRDGVVTECLNSGSSIDDVNKTFGYDKWISYNPKYKNDPVVSSCFSSFYNNTKKSQLNNPTSAVINTNSNKSLFNHNQSNVFNPPTNNQKPSSTNISSKISSNMFGANNSSFGSITNTAGTTTGSSFGGGITNTASTRTGGSFGGSITNTAGTTTGSSFGGGITNTAGTTTGSSFGGSITNTAGTRTSGSFGFGNEKSNNSSNVFGQNLFNSNTTSLLNQPNKNTQSTMYGNEQKQSGGGGGLFGQLPTPYDRSNINQNDDDDEWLGALSHNQPTPILAPGHNSFQSTNTNGGGGGGSMISTPYNQNSGSLLNFDAYNTNMKFNVNVASGSNQNNNSFTFGSNDIVFSNNVQGSTSGVMKSMLSTTTNTQPNQTGNNPASGNVFSNALKNFDFNAKFMK